MTRLLPIVFACFAGLPAVAVASDRGNEPVSPEHRNDLDMTGRRELEMLHCPSAAPGAETVVRPTERGVELLVSAPTEFGRHEIRRRAAMQQTIAERPVRGREEHTGGGTGSTRYGYCPGVMANTTVAVTQTADGSRILVTARRAADVAELQRSTSARATRLRAHRQTAKR
jgi:hypothetical protein